MSKLRFIGIGLLIVSASQLHAAENFGWALPLTWLGWFQGQPSEPTLPWKRVQCAGTYRHHLQGVCKDEGSNIYWSFTTTLVKTDARGRIAQQVEVGNHHGDLCYHDGKVYVAVNFGRFNDPEGNSDSWVYVYNAGDLSLNSKHATREVFHGAGGIGYRDGHFFVVGGLPENVHENYVYEYDREFNFLEKHTVQSGHTHLGIQTATFAHDRWWLGCYGEPKTLLVTDSEFKMLGRFEFDCSLGIVGLPNEQLLAAGGRCEKEEGCTGNVRVVEPHKTQGLRPVSLQGGLQQRR